MSMAEVEEEAADWLVREDRDGWSAADEAARDAWLAQSTANRVAYLRLKSVWQRADRLSVLRTAPVPMQRPVPAPREPVRWQWRRLAAGIAVIGFIGAGVVGVTLVTPRETYETPLGAHETVHLSDGSVMELNTDTAVRATVDDRERRVVLDRGEAYFQVVHDARRPFTVLAGTRRITDLGTKFSVRRDGDRVAVIVTEGRVKIEDLDPAQAPPPVVAKSDMQVLASADSTLVTARTPQQVANTLGWREGLLIFNQETLADAAAEFNRYNQKKLVIDGDAVARTRIGGSFQAANVAAFARLLKEGFGFKIEETDDEVRVSE